MGRVTKSLSIDTDILDHYPFHYMQVQINFFPIMSIEDVARCLEYNKTTCKIYLYLSKTLTFFVNLTIVSRRSIL